MLKSFARKAIPYEPKWRRRSIVSHSGLHEGIGKEGDAAFVKRLNFGVRLVAVVDFSFRVFELSDRVGQGQ